MAAMIETLALLAVVCAVIVVLRPAHLVFAARVSGFSRGGGGGGEKRIRITIIANNTSKHARVQYRSMKTEVWVDDKQWVPVDFDGKTSAQFSGDPWWQPPDNSTLLTARVHVLEADEKKNQPPPPGKLAGDTSTTTAAGASPSPSDNKEYTVVIKTQVQFSYGPARTRFYNIIVTCPPSANANISSDYDTATYVYSSRNDRCT
uniref:Late embryogenesis abundant protein LEA-2 subgroup domain-containing protein n=1 Tax=Oryza glumipatula TaxID=40148 RepID=A0A0E0A4C0_9ORYZ